MMIFPRFASLVVLFFGALSASAQHYPVVVELFTSQGCSSCPPADRNLTAILKEAAQQGDPVYGLSFHVDYWDHIGWKDPYSQHTFTERQRKYALALRQLSLYTPQMIVNGAEELVGSDWKGSRELIKQALTTPPVCTVELNDVQVSEDRVTVRYQLTNLPKDAVINAAIVDASLENYVPRGENRGKKLHHDNVVRAFTVAPAKSSGTLDISVPPEADIDRKLIVYVQDEHLQVLGAASCEVDHAE